MSKKPDYKVEFQEKDKYLFISVTGTDSMETSIAYFTEIFDYIKKTGAEKIIIEENLHESPSLSLIDAYKIVTAVTEMTRGVKAKIAYYDLKKEHAELNAFGESVGLTRGSNIKVVKNLEEAEIHVLS